MKYLKKFNQASEYEAFKVGDEYVLPNVSYVVEGSEVKFDPAVKSLVYNMVDLGLPSGLLWADRNVGAESPEDYGLYFQWGDTVGYTADQVTNGEKVFASDWSDYFDTTDGGSTFNKYAKNKLKVLQPEDDAASVNMGSDWRMPTQAEMQELIDNTTVTFIDFQDNEFSESDVYDMEYNNLKYIKFTGSNNNSIFIPASGYCLDSKCYCANPQSKDIYSTVSIWLSDLYENRYETGESYNLNFNFDTGLYIYYSSRWIGYSIRGVKSK